MKSKIKCYFIILVITEGIKMKLIFNKLALILIIGIHLLILTSCVSYEMVKTSSKSVELKAPAKKWKICINNLPTYEVEKYLFVDNLPDNNIEIQSYLNIFINKNCQIEVLFWNDPQANDFDLAFRRISQGLSEKERSEFKYNNDNLLSGFPEKVLYWDRINETWLSYGITLRQLTIFSYYEEVSFRITISKLFYSEREEYIFDDFLKNLKFVRIID